MRAGGGAGAGGGGGGELGSGWQPLESLWPAWRVWARERSRRLLAWSLLVALVGSATLDGMTWLSPAPPPAGMLTARGQIVAMRDDSAIALQLADRQTGQVRVIWLQMAPGARISMEHLRRHMREHAPTDVEYEPGDGRHAPQVMAAD